MDNPITGVTSLPLDGKLFKIVYDWNALAQISRKYGDDANLFDPAILAEIAAIGLQKHHPDMTADRITELSPPIVNVITVVHNALNVAYFGDRGPPVEGAENPLMARSRRARSKQLSAPSKSASVQESVPTNSGV